MAKIFGDVQERVRGPRSTLWAGRWSGPGSRPDVVTIAGTVGVVAASVAFAARGQLRGGDRRRSRSARCSTCSTGRWPGRGVRPAAVAPCWTPTLDRVADGAIFCGLAMWFAGGDRSGRCASTLICLRRSVVSYARARAEGLGMHAARSGSPNARSPRHPGRQRSHHRPRPPLAARRRCGSSPSAFHHHHRSSGSCMCAPGGRRSVKGRENGSTQVALGARVHGRLATGPGDAAAMARPVRAGQTGPRASEAGACSGWSRNLSCVLGRDGARGRARRAGPRRRCAPTRATGWRRSGCRR